MWMFPSRYSTYERYRYFAPPPDEIKSRFPNFFCPSNFQRQASTSPERRGFKRFIIEMDSDGDMDDETEESSVSAHLSSSDYANPAEVFRVMTVRSEVLKKYEVKNQRNQVMLRNNQRERDELQKRLAYLEAFSETLSETIGSRSGVMSKIRNDLDDLRYWGPTLTLSDLPDELLVEVFMYMGFVLQQRLVRVCNRWKSVVTGLLDHVYMDYAVFDSKQDTWENRVLMDKGSRAWNYRCRFVRSITLDGRCFAEVGRESVFKLTYIRLSPRLERLNIINVLMPPFYAANSAIRDCNWCDRGLPFQISLRNSYIQAFSRNFVDWPQLLAVPQLREMFPKLDSYQKAPCYKRLPDMEITADLYGEKYWKQVSFSEEERTWLKQYAVELDLGFVESLLDRTKFNSERVRPETFCNEHNQMCPHLPAAFYTDKLAEDMQNLLLMVICCLGIPNLSSKQQISRQFFQLNKFVLHHQCIVPWRCPGRAEVQYRKKRRSR